MIDTECLDRQEAQAFLGVGDQTLRQLLKRDDFPRLHIPGVRRLLIPKEALRAWVRQNTTTGGQAGA